MSDLPAAPGPDDALHILVAGTRGFCAGVRRAVDTVELALARYGPPVYVRHEIVHNATVIARLQAMGARFVAENDEVPAGAVLLLSAHGVPPDVEQDAHRLGRRVVDATCPLVAKVHLEARRLVACGAEVVLIGHADHPEVIGTLGWIGAGAHRVATLDDVAALQVADPSRVAYVTQTTLAVTEVQVLVAALLERFPAMQGAEYGQVCCATQNRQDGVRELAAAVDMVLVAGAANSSNANRLREVAEAAGCPARLVAEAEELDAVWFAAARRIGITAAASTPESVVEGLISRIRLWRAVTVSELPGIEEPYRFRLPAAFEAELPA